MNRKLACRRHAYTIVEIAIIVSIVGIMFSLAIPAVQSAREAARSAQCISNLRQIGIAMHAYSAAHGMFPISYPKTSAHSSSNRISAHSFMLPHLDKIGLYNSINMDLSPFDSPETPLLANRTARSTKVGMFMCPSDIGKSHSNNYRFNYGKRASRRFPALDGPFGYGVMTSHASVKDGLSNTAFVSERIAGTFVAGSTDRIRDVKLIAPLPGHNLENDYIEECSISEIYNWFNFSGRYWMYSGMLDVHYNHSGSPNDNRTSCGGIDYGLHPPRSHHSDNVKVLFGDGHVKNIKNEVSKQVWSAMGTHAGGD